MADELNGFLLIADISGYTNYLNESELQHAQGTLTDLLELLIEQTRPPLVISRLEGDAVVSYGLKGDFPSGQAFVESIENTYVVFRKAIELMVLNNTCKCNACANVSSLDLKFVVHHGTFLIQRLGGYDELMGSDVNLIHRLLKNTVSSETGISAYCLYTAQAVRQLGIEDFGGMVRYSEDVSDFGDVDVWIQDMHPIYEARRGESQVVVSDDDVGFESSIEVSMGPEAVWGYLTDPEFRSVLIGSDRQEITGERREGRIGTGSIYQCYHGNQVLPQVVLEWHPFTRIVTQDQMGRPMKGTFLADYRLEPTESGTRLRRLTGGFIAKPFTRGLLKLSGPFMSRAMDNFMEEFRKVTEEDWQQNAGNRVAPMITSESVAAAAAASFEQS
jgi:uncharacterized protein YndB with AHSA1/START domain